MGGHCRYQGAILIAALLLIVSAQSQAATRKYVTIPPAYTALKTNTGLPVTSGGVLKVNGPLEGDYIPGSRTKFQYQPRYDFSIPRTINHAKSGLRAGWPGMVAAVGIGLALDSMDAWLDPETGVPMRSGEGDIAPVDPSIHYHWAPGDYVAGYAGDPITACKLYEGMESPADNYVYSDIRLRSPTVYDCMMLRVSKSTGRILEGPTNKFAYWSSEMTVTRRGVSCPDGTINDGLACRYPGVPVPFSDADYDLLGDFISQQNSEWLRDLLRDVCEASPSPSRCYEEMLDGTALDGPTTVPGPTTTNTTTTTAADGTQQQTTTTTRTEYNIRYGDNYYDYSERKISTITHPDGSTTQEVTAEPDTETPSQEEPAYSFQDSAFPEVEPFYEQKYPDGLQGVWANASAQLNNSAFMSFLNSFVPTFSGSCPSWSMSFDIASWASYGTHNFPSLCYVFDFIKVIILVSAAFLCRAIIFGG